MATSYEILDRRTGAILACREPERWRLTRNAGPNRGLFGTVADAVEWLANHRQGDLLRYEVRPATNQPRPGSMPAPAVPAGGNGHTLAAT